MEVGRHDRAVAGLGRRLQNWPYWIVFQLSDDSLRNCDAKGPAGKVILPPVDAGPEPGDSDIIGKALELRTLMWEEVGE